VIYLTNYARALYFLNNLIKRSYWKHEKLFDYQDERLRNIIRYAYDYVPFYHQKFRESGIRPEEIKTTTDLNKLPIIKKDEIRSNVEDMISKGFNRNDLKMLSTSGSTGKPLFLFLSRSESEFRKAKHLRANMSCGQRPWDKWVTITAPHHFAEATRLQEMLGLFAPTPISVFEDIKKQISILDKTRPDVLDGYSSSLFLIAKQLDGGRIGRIKPRIIFGGAELLDAYSREYVERVLNAPFYDQYSSVELERMAWQCSERRGYHIDADAVILQFVDKDGEEVSVGESGEIICTSLFNYAMPFIRYAISDVGRQSDEICTCGRSLPMMRVVEGRKDSLLVLSNGHIMTPRAFTIAMNMFKFYKYIDQFRVIQKKPDHFEFRLKMKNTAPENRCLDESTVEVELISHFSKLFKLNKDAMKFDIRFVEAIPLDKSGKLMTVVSALTQNPKP
jgi:phenylacetate-CoA ligase